MEELVKLVQEKFSRYPRREIKSDFLIPSAVLIPIFEDELIFIKRNEKVKDHKGQIAFPGGVIEEGENPVETALREAWEEVGIKPENVKVIGLADDQITALGYLITPVVGVVSDWKPNPNFDEVDEVFSVDFRKLIEARELGKKGVEYIVDDKVIWGATARILDNFFEVLGLL